MAANVGAARDMVSFMLMGGEEGEAAASLLEESGTPGLSVRNNGCYFTIEAPRRLEIDLDELGERVGRPIDISAFLVVMASFVGRIEIEGNRIAVCAEMIDLEERTAAGPGGPADESR